MIGMVLNTVLLAAAMAAGDDPVPSGCEVVPTGGRVRLSVMATAVRNERGEVAFTLYPDDARRFLAQGGKLLRLRVPARSPQTSACFMVPPGHYAVATYHDENGDRDFNRTLFSVKEGFGFSNDAPASFGLPRFEQARFLVRSEGAVIRVRTRYPR